jgi:hypothetical protein
MYFQTGQVIFVPEWPKGELLGCNWLHSVWTKLLVCKDAFNRGSAIQKWFRRLCIDCKSEDFRFPVSRPDDVSSRPDPHLSTISSVRTHDRPSIIRLDNVEFCSDPSLCRDGWCLHPSGRLSGLDQVSDSFQVQIREDWFNRPDDVDSRPDVLIHKARIAIQIPSSRRLSAWSGRALNRYGNCTFDFNRPDACLPLSGRALNQYGNCVLKINRPDDHPPWSGRPSPLVRTREALYENYLQRTCDRSDDNASPSGHGFQTGKIFSENLRNSGLTIVRPDGPCPPFGRRPHILLQSPIWTWAYK